MSIYKTNTDLPRVSEVKTKGDYKLNSTNNAGFSHSLGKSQPKSNKKPERKPKSPQAQPNDKKKEQLKTPPKKAAKPKPDKPKPIIKKPAPKKEEPKVTKSAPRKPPKNSSMYHVEEYRPEIEIPRVKDYKLKRYKTIAEYQLNNQNSTGFQHSIGRPKGNKYVEKEPPKRVKSAKVYPVYDIPHNEDDFKHSLGKSKKKPKPVDRMDLIDNIVFVETAGPISPEPETPDEKKRSFKKETVPYNDDRSLHSELAEDETEGRKSQDLNEDDEEKPKSPAGEEKDEDEEPMSDPEEDDEVPDHLQESRRESVNGAPLTRRESLMQDEIFRSSGARRMSSVQPSVINVKPADEEPSIPPAVIVAPIVDQKPDAAAAKPKTRDTGTQMPRDAETQVSPVHSAATPYRPIQAWAATPKSQPDAQQPVPSQSPSMTAQPVVVPILPISPSDTSDKPPSATSLAPSNHSVPPIVISPAIENSSGDTARPDEKPAETNADSNSRPGSKLSTVAPFIAARQPDSRPSSNQQQSPEESRTPSPITPPPEEPPPKPIPKQDATLIPQEPKPPPTVPDQPDVKPPDVQNRPLQAPKIPPPAAKPPEPVRAQHLFQHTLAMMSNYIQKVLHYVMFYLVSKNNIVISRLNKCVITQMFDVCVCVSVCVSECVYV